MPDPAMKVKSYRLPSTVIDAVDRAAERAGLKPSDYVRRALAKATGLPQPEARRATPVTRDLAALARQEKLNADRARKGR